MLINNLTQLVFPKEQENSGDLQKGFIVQVYGKNVSILVNRLWTEQKDKKTPDAGFFEFNYSNGNLNTRSKDIQTVLTRALENNGKDGIKLYYFSSLKEFADAILKNDWKIHTE